MEGLRFLLQFPFGNTPYDTIPEIFSFDAMAEIDFVSRHCVDITETFEAKKRKLACHRSQSA
jgi:LmbE family N-acetylglucosaminyl deacetylase